MTDWRRNIEMRQYQIKITELAEEDLENASDYIAYELKQVNNSCKHIDIFSL